MQSNMSKSPTAPSGGEVESASAEAAPAAPATSARLSETLAGLFPDGVVAAELEGAAAVAGLTPEERAGIAHCAPARIQQFAAGRACAHRALRQFGIEGFSLLAGADRRPVWPPGIVGSLTHTEDYAAAVVGRADGLLGLGVDCEGAERVMGHLWRRIATPLELERLNALDAGDASRCAALLFAAKEAFYKCQFPLTTEWLGFGDVRVELEGWGDPAGELRLLPQRSLLLEKQCPAPWRGRFLFRGARVIVGVALTA
ncbi:MAG TPA: 4'-phosphopantetheinyl transferase superfamily protein [Steroidobacteraceae bacterium]|nr:4'-phosphopantetheinyl transferase superfamily protein [Steroidobacteraceae bacterium]